MQIIVIGVMRLVRQHLKGYAGLGDGVLCADRKDAVNCTKPVMRRRITIAKEGI